MENLEKLHTLKLGPGIQTFTIPSEVAKSLKVLDLSWCHKLIALPYGMEKLHTLKLGRPDIQTFTIPSEAFNVKILRAMQILSF